MKRIVAVLWSGLIGGAESFSVALVRELKQQGMSVAVLFVSDPEPLVNVIERSAIEYATLGYAQGRDVIRHPLRVARAAQGLGADGALLIQPGFLAAALRAGGYRGRVVAVNHGEPLHENSGAVAAAKRVLVETSGRWAADVEVAVSDTVFNALKTRRHARQLVRIYNGVDLEQFTPSLNGTSLTPLVVGWAGRLIPGKGVEDLIAAAAKVRQRFPIVVRIAGEGHAHRALFDAPAAAEFVRFEGAVVDMPSFWRGCHVATAPSKGLIESFGMAAAEAMACGLPVVASRLGALPEVVADGNTGFLFEPGNVGELAAALERYAVDEQLRRDHGRNARRLCEERFDLRDCAERYRALFEHVAR